MDSSFTSKIIFFNLTSIRHWVVIYTWFRAGSAACGKWGIRNTHCPALWGTTWSHTIHRGSWNACHKRAQIALDASSYVLWKRNQAHTCNLPNLKHKWIIPSLCNISVYIIYCTVRIQIHFKCCLKLLSNSDTQQSLSLSTFYCKLYCTCNLSQMYLYIHSVT